MSVDHRELAFDAGGRQVEVAMHADAGKIVRVLAPAWASSVGIAFFEASVAPPTEPTPAAGWYTTGGTEGQLIGAGAWYIAEGGGLVIEREPDQDELELDLACAVAAGVARLRFERAER